MKFECPSCAKKYSLPDEKVPAGKDFKVKCKKCGEIIVLRAPDPAEAAPAQEQAFQAQEPAQEPVQDEAAAFGSQQAGAFGQPAAGPFDQQAAGPFDAPAAAPGAAAPDEQPTRVFDYSSMGADQSDPVQAATAQAEAFQAPAAEPPAQEEPPAGPPPGGDDLEWHIAVDGDQMGPYETAQMLEMMAANQINEETYVWRDGYDDWLPLSDVSELQAAGAPAPAMAPAPAAASPGSPFAIASGGAGGQDLFASAGSEGAVESSPFAAPSAGGGVSTSLGAEPQSPRVAASDLKGARHENSVLFSLSSLQALASSSRDPAPVGLGAATSEGGSGLIDIKSLTAGASLGSSDTSPSDDILSIGGGGIGSPVGVPSLLQPTKQEPSKLPYILAGVFGLIAIAGVAVVLVVVLGRDKTPEIDEEALRAKIMEELMAKGMTKEEAAAQAKEEAAEQVAATEAEGAEGEGAGSTEGEGEGDPGAAAKKKKGGGGGKKKATGDETPGEEPPVKETTGGGGKKTAAEDDLMALLAGATKGKKAPTKKEPEESGTKPPSTTPKPASDLPDKPTKQDVMSALNGVKPKVQACGKGQTGVATVSINIAGSTGKVASAKVVSGPFKGTPNAGCIESAVKKAKFSKFKQAKFSVSYPFVIK